MIRPAAAGDADTVRAVVHAAYGHYIARIGKPPGPMLDDYAARIAAGQTWVLQQDDRIVGILVLEEHADALLLDNIAVHPEAQGGGHGRSLMLFAETEARRRGRREIHLYTHALMTENQALYRRLGYVETGRVQEKGFDRVYMAKPLADAPSHAPLSPAEAQSDRRPRVAIVLFNLGGPDRPEAIRPFLLNLFSDPAILRVPFFIRPLLARLITRARLKPATENYALLGGRSPLLELTRTQAAALSDALPELDAQCFIAMRYWHPLSLDAARAVKAWGPQRVVLLPLYPQYSTTTTGSSLTAWREAAARVGLVAPVTALCCYPVDPGYIRSTAALLRDAYSQARAALPADVKLRVLFSAHGLPEKIVRAGDPYQDQIGRTVAAVLRAWGQEGLDWTICYQSRATPVRWIGPSTDAEIERAGHDKVAVLVVPIAFLSEHSETLVELDVEYRRLAEKVGVPGYFRVPAQNADAAFINALATLARSALARGGGLCSASGTRLCAADRTGCPLTRMQPAVLPNNPQADS